MTKNCRPWRFSNAVSICVKVNSMLLAGETAQARYVCVLAGVMMVTKVMLDGVSGSLYNSEKKVLKGDWHDDEGLGYVGLTVVSGLWSSATGRLQKRSNGNR